MLVAVLSGYLFALLAPPIAWAVKRAAGPLIATLPAFLFAYLLQFVPEAAMGRPWRFASPWDAVSGLEVSFRADGLSLLFGLLISLIGAAVLVGTAGLSLSAQSRQRLLLALAALIASCLGFVFADQPVLLASFSAATSIAAFLAITAEEGAEGRTRALPLLMIWLFADLGFLALLARLFADVPGGLLGANGISALPVNGHPEPGWIVAIVALKAIPAFFVLSRSTSLPAPAAGGLGGLALPAILALLFRFVELLPPEAHIALGALGVVGILIGALISIGSQRLVSIVCGLTLSVSAMVILELALGTDLGATAALLTTATGALGLTALLLAVFATSGREVVLADLGSGFLRAPLTAGVIGIAVLILAGALPSIGMLALFAASKAAFASEPWLAAPLLLCVMAFPMAAALRLLMSTALGRATASAPRARFPIAGASIVLLLIAVVCGLMPGFLDRALISPAIKVAGPALFGTTLEGWLLIAGAAALAGLLFWQQSLVARALAFAAAITSRLRVPLPVTLRNTWRRLAAARSGMRAQTAIVVASFILVASLAAAISAGWPNAGLAATLPDPLLIALAAIAAVSALLALAQRRLSQALPMLAIAGMLCVLVTLGVGAVDLAFVLLLVIILETVILIAMSARGEASAALVRGVRLGPVLRGAIAFFFGVGVVLAGFEATPARTIAEAGSGITGLIDASGLALRQTGLAAIERWGGIVLLLTLFGIAVTDLSRRPEDEV